jgi:hypothetical protein
MAAPLLSLARAAQGRPPHLGLEHEFVVSQPAGVVDFRTIIHGLGLGPPNLDPADPDAYRLPSGAAVTCDAAEAEVSLSPTPVRPGFGLEVAWRAGAERASLIGRLPSDMRLGGYSTHLSVSVPNALTKAVCQIYARRFAAAMMLLIERRDSLGLLVRPRPGRVEIGATFLGGRQLVPAAVFAAGSVLACLDRVASGASDDPPELDVRLEPAIHRFGSYVDRSAFGVDLYDTGRRACLRTVDGRHITAQADLEQAWLAARRAIERMASPEELAVTDDVVSGRSPLPGERVVEEPIHRPATARLPEPDSYGAALATRHGSTFDVAPVMLTWELAIFLILGRSRRARAFAVVPGSALGTFLPALDSGVLDAEVARFLRRRRRTRRLASWAEIDGPTLYDSIGPRIGLLRPEYGRDGELPAATNSPAARLRLPMRRWSLWRRTDLTTSHANA